MLCSSASIWRTDDPTDGSAWQHVVQIDLNDSPWTGGHPSEYVRVEDPYLWQDAATGFWHLVRFPREPQNQHASHVDFDGPV